MDGYTIFGTLQYTTIIIIVNIKIYLISYNVSILLIFVMFLSIALYFANVYLMSNILYTFEFQGVWSNAFGRTNPWIGIFLIFVFTIGIDYFLSNYSYFKKVAQDMELSKIIEDAERLLE